METGRLVSHVDTEKITRDQLVLLPTPAGTETHKIIPHIEVVNSIVETLGFRHIAVHREEYAISQDGNKLFGLMELDQTFGADGGHGCRFALGVRNSHDKTMRLAMTVGYRVFVCDNMAFQGDFSPLLAKHTKNFNLLQALSYGVDQMQRNFEPMVKAVECWQTGQLTDVNARMIIYRAFVEGELDAPRHLARSVHDLYFNPTEASFQPRTMWSMSNAFTSALKQLEPIPQFRATARLATYLGAVII